MHVCIKDKHPRRTGSNSRKEKEKMGAKKRHLAVSRVFFENCLRELPIYIPTLPDVYLR